MSVRTSDIFAMAVSQSASKSGRFVYVTDVNRSASPCLLCVSELVVLIQKPPRDIFFILNVPRTHVLQDESSRHLLDQSIHSDKYSPSWMT